jgi:hypothetical protein
VLNEPGIMAATGSASELEFVDGSVPLGNGATDGILIKRGATYDSVDETTFSPAQLDGKDITTLNEGEHLVVQGGEVTSVPLSVQTIDSGLGANVSVEVGGSIYDPSRNGLNGRHVHIGVPSSFFSDSSVVNLTNCGEWISCDDTGDIAVPGDFNNLTLLRHGAITGEIPPGANFNGGDKLHPQMQFVMNCPIARLFGSAGASEHFANVKWYSSIFCEVYDSTTDTLLEEIRWAATGTYTSVVTPAYPDITVLSASYWSTASLTLGYVIAGSGASRQVQPTITNGYANPIRTVLGLTRTWWNTV